MYANVSSSFLSKIAQPSRHFEARFYDGSTLLDLEILHIDVTTGTCGGSNLAVGCAFAGYLTVSARYTDIQLEGKELKLELGLLLDDSTYEYIPFGYWTVQKPTVQKDIMSFTAVDRMASKFNEDYSSSLTYPATIASVLSELSTATGVTINCNLQTSLQMPVAIEDMSQRGALAVIANCLLACAWVDRNGMVNITAYGNSSTQAAVDYDYVKEQPNMDEKETLISGVKVYTVDGQTDTWIETGTDHMITTSNVYTTQTILDATADNIVGLEYNGGSVKFMGNPLLDPSDTITFNDGESDQYIPCMEITQSFDGGLTTSVNAPGSFEVTESTIQTGPIAQEMERRARATAEAQATADAALAAANQAAADMAQAVLDINSDIAELQDQIDGNITSWFYEVDPTLSNPPASTWTTTADKNNHLGDLYYNTANGHVWRWVKEGNTYKWSQISDSDITEALALAQHAQDTADSKRRVFFATPVPPYDRGDLWVQGAGGDILRCNTAKTESESYAFSDWVKASKYTDDSAAIAAQATANNALTMANGKNKIFYSDTAPTTGMTSGDMWMNTGSGNALYQYNGTSWVIRQLGQGSIVAGSITTNELYGNTISALRSNLGTITAGILQSYDYDYGTGPYYCQEGMIISLNSKIIMTPKFSVIGGVLRATDGIFSGQITAKSGTIGGYTISSSANTGTTANGGHVYTNSLYTHTSDSSYEYESGLFGGGVYNSAAFYIRRISPGAAWNTSEYTFYVRNDGYMYATRGSLAGWNITNNQIDKSSAIDTSISSEQIQYQAFMRAYGTVTGTTYAFCAMQRTYRNGSYGTWASNFYVRYDGYLYATKGSIAGSIITRGIDASNITAGTISASVIAANSISVSKLTGSISRDNWVIDLDNGSLTIGNISAAKINAGTLNAERIAAHSISVSKLTGNITNSDWELDLDDGTLTIGTISANNVKTGILSATGGDTSWNLNTGVFSTVSGTRSTRVTGGRIRFFNDSNEMGRIAPVNASDEMGEGVAFAAGENASYLGIGRRYTSSSGGVGYQSHIMINCGVNPDGRTERLVFRGPSYFSGAVNTGGNISFGGSVLTFSAESDYATSIYRRTASGSNYISVDARLTVGSSGPEGVAGYIMHVMGGARFEGAGRFTGRVTAAGFDQTSDENLKDIIPWDDRLDELIGRIEPICFRWKDGDDKRLHIGVGARNTNGILTELGLTDTGIVTVGSECSVDYIELSVILLHKYQQRIKELENRISYLEHRVA